MLAAGKGGKSGATAQAGRCACEKDGSLVAGQHFIRDLSPDQKSGQRTHFPDFPVYPGSGLTNRVSDISAHIKNGDPDRTETCFDVVDQIGYLGFITGIGVNSCRTRAQGPDFVAKCIPVATPSGNNEMVALPCESSGDC